MEVRYAHRDIKIFIDALEKPSRTKTARYIDLLAQKGKSLGMPFSKHIGDGILELRMVGTQNVRILYGFHSNCVWLLLGLSKKSQKLSARDIQTASQRLKHLRAI
ncbi:MAG TPA: type II toxin-antitoxin system RelE/ParE family toxin [Candidatus Paceibacterota bacterium]